MTSTPTRPVDNVVITTKGLQERNKKCLMEGRWKIKVNQFYAKECPSSAYSLFFINYLWQLGIESVTDMLKTTPVEDFQHCYQNGEQRLHRCVAAKGNYFEGDHIDVWKKLKLW